MTARLTVPLGVIVAREANEHPWEQDRWRTVGVCIDALDKADWRRHRRLDAHYHTATLPLTLQRKETLSYRVNLTNGEPTLYVVLRYDPASTQDGAITVRWVTASPLDAQSHTDPALDWVDRVPMPARLISIVEGFVASDCDQVEVLESHASPQLIVHRDELRPSADEA